MLTSLPLEADQRVPWRKKTDKLPSATPLSSIAVHGRDNVLKPFLETTTGGNSTPASVDSSGSSLPPVWAV